MKIEKLKSINLNNKTIESNNEILIREKNLAMLFCNDFEGDKNIREKIVQNCKEIKLENIQLKSENEEVMKVLNQLPFKYKQILEMTLVNKINSKVVCQKLNLSKKELYKLKAKAIRAFENGRIP